MTDGTGTRKQAKAGPRRRRSHNAPPVGPAAFADRSATTIADSIHQRLRQEIVSMALVPGTPISEMEVAQAEGVSRTPVREAILRLADERLVEVVPKSGSFVARIPLSALPEAIVARHALETATVRAAARNAAPDDIAALKAIVELQRREAGAGLAEAFHRADEAFHAAIARVAGYPGLWDIIQQVKVQVDRCRRLSLPQEGRMQTVIAEHARIVEAIAAGDEAGAVARMGEHLSQLPLDIPIFRDQWPEYFVHDIDSDPRDWPPAGAGAARAT